MGMPRAQRSDQFPGDGIFDPIVYDHPPRGGVDGTQFPDFPKPAGHALFQHDGAAFDGAHRLLVQNRRGAGVHHPAQALCVPQGGDGVHGEGSGQFIPHALQDLYDVGKPGPAALQLSGPLGQQMQGTGDPLGIHHSDPARGIGLGRHHGIFIGGGDFGGGGEADHVVSSGHVFPEDLVILGRSWGHGKCVWRAPASLRDHIGKAFARDDIGQRHQPDHEPHAVLAVHAGDRLSDDSDHMRLPF